jgi:hypothetical protein
MVMSAARSLVASFAAMVTVTLAAPVLDAGATEIHGADGVAVQAHEAVVSTGTTKLWPLAATWTVAVGTE